MGVNPSHRRVGSELGVFSRIPASTGMRPSISLMEVRRREHMHFHRSTFLSFSSSFHPPAGGNQLLQQADGLRVFAFARPCPVSVRGVCEGRPGALSSHVQSK